jgi:hypothetical protein
LLKQGFVFNASGSQDFLTSFSSRPVPSYVRTQYKFSFF